MEIFRKTVTNFHFLPPVYKISIARQILILSIVHIKALRNADNLITVSSFDNCKTNCSKELTERLMTDRGVVILG